MSRGPGHVERGILEGLRNLGRSSADARELAGYIFEVDRASLTAAQLGSVRRALRRLAMRGKIKLEERRLRYQSSHHHADRGLDPYWTPPQAVASLLHIEAQHLPRVIWGPAAGKGHIVRPLREAGFTVIGSDIADYGLAGCTVVDYLEAEPIAEVQGIVTNPPFRQAVQFAEKALGEVTYLALLLRTNFLESQARKPFLQRHPVARIWVSSRRLPMMHREGWQGRRASSNVAYAWFVWDAHAEHKMTTSHFDWADYWQTASAGG